MEWIKLSERMPTREDGLCQIWLPKEGLGGLVIGYQADMYDSDKLCKEGVWDIVRQGIWDYSDFLYWMRFPSLPSDFPKQTYEQYLAERHAFETKLASDLANG